MLKIGMRELCDRNDTGSPGAYYIAHHVYLAGYIIDYPAKNNTEYDIELLSIHHCTDFLRLLDLPKIAPMRIIGGHPMQNNPLPVIPFCDAVLKGEGETAIKAGLKIIEKKGIEGLHDEPGWIVSKYWKHGDKLPETVIEKELPEENPPYLNHAGTKSAAWYIEIARGCPFACAYCELGHSTKYRAHSMEYIEKAIDSIDVKKSRKINIYAPDEASFPFYSDVQELIEKKGCSTSFSSMRIDTVQKSNIQFKKNHLIRIGIDGLTEKTRFKVGKRIKNIDIIQYFHNRISDGYVQFKMFMIFGYEWEKPEDFKEFSQTMEAVGKLSYRKNISIRIKWTPFIPQPCTPLKNCTPLYDYDMVQSIKDWHDMVKVPNGIGAYITNDGLMGERSHKEQVYLTRGDEESLLRLPGYFGKTFLSKTIGGIV
ncbi:hypothetical protein FACS1894151_08770 [Spirochaetia bacterium]|nr:hypothetical protein FACS1894151_08770 [Spirochaetia bacterium]